MKKLLEFFQKAMAAAAFAEEGEWHTARQLLPAGRSPARLTQLDRIFAAVAFAEENMQEEARTIARAPMGLPHFAHEFLGSLGLKGVRARFLVLPAGSSSDSCPYGVASE